MHTVSLKTVPSPCHWAVEPETCQLHADGSLQISAGPATDLFIDPRAEYDKANAPRLAFAPDTIFTVQARVQVAFQADYDAGAFILWADAQYWAKFAFEFSPQKQPTIVSVVTHETSDDCNGMTIAANEVYLRVAKLAGAYAFHASPDGRFWQLIRYFSSARLESAAVNFSAQSPTGGGCTAVFSDILYTTNPLTDIRNGT